MTISNGSGVRDSGDPLLAQARSVVESHLQAAVGRLDDPLRSVAGYHFGWWDAGGQPTDSSGGKFLRATLALECAVAVGASPRSAVPAAVAIELAHNFTLLHDDVMDGDRMRRHRPSAWAVFGEATAMLTGNALLVVAMQELAACPAAMAGPANDLLCAALVDVVAGQSSDLAFEQRTDVHLDECLAMATKKTAALIACPCALGALLGDAEPSRVRHLQDFGRELGLAYQLADDIRGIWGDPGITGKPIGSDLRSAKKSLPVVAALCSETSAAEELEQLYRVGPPLDDDQIERAAALIEQAGGRSWTEEEAQRRLDLAAASLAAAEPAAPSAERLLAFSRQLVRASQPRPYEPTQERV